MKSKVLSLCLLLAGALVISGCGGLARSTADNASVTDNQTAKTEPETQRVALPTREGWARPRSLTSQEQERALMIARKVRELGEWLPNPYHTKMVWFVKTDSGWTITDEPTPSTRGTLGFYPGVSIIFDPPLEVAFDIAVDLDGGRPVRFRQSIVEEHFLPRPLTDEERMALFMIAETELEKSGGGNPDDYDRPFFVWMAHTLDGEFVRLGYDILEKGLPANPPVHVDYYPGVVFEKDITPYEKHFTTVVLDLHDGNFIDIVYTTELLPAPVPHRGPQP